MLKIMFILYHVQQREDWFFVECFEDLFEVKDEN